MFIFLPFWKTKEAWKPLLVTEESDLNTMYIRDPVVSKNPPIVLPQKTPIRALASSVSES